MPPPSCLSYSTYQLAFALRPRSSSAPSIEAPRLRTGTHLHKAVSYPFSSCPASSRSIPFLFGPLGSRAGHQNEVGGCDDDGSSIGILEAPGDEADASTSHDAVDVFVEKIGRNKRRITASISIGTPLDAVWNILTDYEGLAEFLPGLAVSELLDQWEHGARLLQIGEQNLALGLKFRAKGVINVHEHPLEVFPSGIRRDVDFEMIEGDFKIFNGTWHMEQTSTSTLETLELPKSGSAVSTSLTYKLDVQPEIWLPVALVEGRLKKEIKTNLVCIRDEALRRHLSLYIE